MAFIVMKKVLKVEAKYKKLNKAEQREFLMTILGNNYKCWNCFFEYNCKGCIDYKPCA